MRTYSDNAISPERFAELERIALGTAGNMEYIKTKAKQAWAMSLVTLCISAITLGIVIASISS